MARLLLIEKGKIAREIQIVEETTRIGREKMNEINLNGPTVSRFHAEITRRGHCYSIQDKKSTNGTGLNGELLQGKTVLNHNDKISVGNFTLVFETDDADQPVTLDADNFSSAETVFDLTQKIGQPK